ncbi:MAG TPA: hypothetical protein VLW53_18545, partial [Candidatus Eisenbacteria bacterium]|nr:hypothetical protein [Candidatus Eisenbacteria bacterium]
LQSGLVNVSAVLEPDELRDIIEAPAAAAGLSLEPDLAERIAGDAARATLPPGGAGRNAATTVLPLLESALTELWRNREEGRLTHRAYERTGGVVASLSRWCDEAYRSLPPAQRSAARHVLTALVRPADDRAGVPATRQRRTLDQLYPDSRPPGTSADDVGRVVVSLADRRLLITGRDPVSGAAVVDLAHDALIQGWGLLGQWLAEDHDFLVWRNDVETAQARWRTSRGRAGARDPDLLLRGAAVETARDWLQRRPGELHADVVEFIAHSDRAQRGLQLRDRRRVRLLAGLLALTVTLGSVAFFQSLRASDEARRAGEAAQVANARRLAIQAVSLIDRQQDLAQLLGLESLRTAPTQDSWGSIQATLSRPVHASHQLSGFADWPDALAFSPDGTLLATTDFGSASIRLWDVASQRLVGSWTADTGGLGAHGIAFSPDGRLLAVIGSDGVQLYGPASRRPVGSRFGGEQGLLAAIAFSPDGRLLASTAQGDGEIALWDAGTQRQVGAGLGGRDGNIVDVAFSPDSRLVASGSDLGIVQLFDAATGRSVDRFSIQGGASSLAFSPDGTVLAIAGELGSAYLVDVREHRLIDRPLSHPEGLHALAFSPDGRLLATGSASGVVRLWDVASRQLRTDPLVGHVDEIEALAFSPDGSRIATASRDGTARLWDVQARQPLGDVLAGHVRSVNAIAFQPRGRLLASGGFDTTVRLWD